MSAQYAVPRYVGASSGAGVLATVLAAAARAPHASTSRVCDLSVRARPCTCTYICTCLTCELAPRVRVRVACIYGHMHGGLDLIW